MVLVQTCVPPQHILPTSSKGLTKQGIKTIEVGEVFRKRRNCDLFLENIQLIQELTPSPNIFSDFNGLGTNLCAAATYFADQFQGINKTRNREIYIHYTNATDPKMLQVTMASVHPSVGLKLFFSNVIFRIQNDCQPLGTAVFLKYYVRKLRV
jgi:hypothetical protein